MNHRVVFLQTVFIRMLLNSFQHIILYKKKENKSSPQIDYNKIVSKYKIHPIE